MNTQLQHIYKKYKLKGINGLNIAHGGGIKRKINEEQEKVIVETIATQTPDEVGFENRKNWTIELIL